MPTPTGRTYTAEESTERGFAILEASAVVGTIIVSNDGAILAANAKMRHFLGISADAAPRIAEHLVDPVVWAHWREASGPLRALEIELRGFDGTTQLFRSEVSAQGEGAKRRFFVLLVEGGDSKALRAAAQHSARMEALGSLTAGVAHDFNNLLTVLVGNLYLVGEELREQPRVFDKLKLARDAGKRGSELIKQLMTFARREQIVVGTLEPANVVRELLPLLQRALGTRITLETRLQENIGVVRASVAQLESVVVNLAVNARDAIEGKGKISIGVRAIEVADEEAALRGLPRGGPHVAISVSDTGSGIPADALPRVFEPFFSTKGEHGGTGLGLSMVRWFAEQAGGCAGIESVVGTGTTVTLLLPRRLAEHATETGERTMPLSTLPTGTERVVVLAADEALRQTIHETLEVLGYRVRVAQGVEDMLTTVAAGPSALLVVDGLGRGDVDVLIRARALQPQLRIMVTADQGRPAEWSYGLGVATLAKPFTLADLAGAVRRTLDSAVEARAQPTG